DLTRGPRVVDAHSKDAMRQVLKEIQKDQGAVFAKEWLAETAKGYPEFNRLREKGKQHKIEETGAKLRGMMKFLKKK
ncbi:MAG: ketol-acid reductoisomerase, partial [Leptonema sp. (in: Bacteria)]|nr:ketol-acid reductoisomerase [Leptonema sp. (in: bacteria)]